MNRTFASLAYPNYRKWFFGAIIANVGTWMMRVAQTWIVLTEFTSDSGLAVSLVIALQFLPVMLLTPVGGLLADRMPRKMLLQLTTGGLVVASLALGVMLQLGAVILWHIYVFALVAGILAALDGPVRQTFVTELVPGAALPNAVGLNAASFNLARIIGPAAAGFLLAWVGSGPVFLITGFAFLGPMISIAVMTDEHMYTEPRGPREEGKRNLGLVQAIRYVREHSDLAVIMALMGVVSAFGLNFQLFISTMAREAFLRGPEDYGVLNAVMGVGALTGALLAARRVRPRTRIVVFSALAYGIVLLAAAFAPSYGMFAALLILAGLSSTTMMNTANATIQLGSEPYIRGRVMSLYLMLFLGSTPIASPLMGWVSEEYGARASVAAGATISILAALAAVVWAWRSWGVRVAWEIRPRPSLQFINPTDQM